MGTIITTCTMHTWERTRITSVMHHILCNVVDYLDSFHKFKKSLPLVRIKLSSKWLA